MRQSSGRTSVYLYRDQYGFLLYVGITSRGVSRNTEHAGSKLWWKYVEQQDIEHYDTRHEALKRESDLIREYRPPFNVQLNASHQQSMQAYEALVMSLDDVPDETPKTALVRIGKRIPMWVVAHHRDEMLVATSPFDKALTSVVIWKPTMSVKANGTRVGSVRKLDASTAIVRMSLTLNREVGQVERCWTQTKVVSQKQPFTVEAQMVMMVTAASKRGNV